MENQKENTSYSKNLIEWLVVKYKVSLISFIVLVISLILYVSISSNYTGTYAEAIELVAIGMVPACLIGVLWEVFIKKEFVQYIIKEVVVEMDVIIKKELAQYTQYILREVHLSNQIAKFGIKGIFPHRDERHIINSFENANTRIWILLTWLSYLTDTGIQTAFMEKAKNKKIDIRVLGLNSESTCAELRSKIHDKYESLKREIPNYRDRFIYSLIKKIGKNAENVKVGLYDAESPIACFIIDNDLYFCPLLFNDKRGRHSVHFLVSNSIDNESQLFSEIEEHFNYLFEKRATLIYPIEPKDSKSISQTEIKR